MTITIAWWFWPILFMVVGVALAAIFGRQQGDYDMVSPLLGAGLFLCGLVAAIGYMIGRWLA